MKDTLVDKTLTTRWYEHICDHEVHGITGCHPDRCFFNLADNRLLQHYNYSFWTGYHPKAWLKNSYPASIDEVDGCIRPKIIEEHPEGTCFWCGRTAEQLRELHSDEMEKW